MRDFVDFISNGQRGFVDVDGQRGFVDVVSGIHEATHIIRLLGSLATVKEASMAALA